jgi:hypothetical protein
MAVKVRPPNPAFSTTIEAVLCPAVIVPADTVHLKLSLSDGAEPAFAVNLNVELSSESEHSTEIVGHIGSGSLWEYARSAPAVRMKSNKSQGM